MKLCLKREMQHTHTASVHKMYARRQPARHRRRSQTALALGSMPRMCFSPLFQTPPCTGWRQLVASSRSQCQNDRTRMHSRPRIRFRGGLKRKATNTQPTASSREQEINTQKRRGLKEFRGLGFRRLLLPGQWQCRDIPSYIPAPVHHTTKGHLLSVAPYLSFTRRIDRVLLLLLLPSVLVVWSAKDDCL